METKIQKWGNRLAVRLPKRIATKFELQEGSWVLVTEGKENIIIKRSSHKKPPLKDLVDDINSKNIHNETSWNSPQGKEVW